MPRLVFYRYSDETNGSSQAAAKSPDRTAPVHTTCPMAIPQSGTASSIGESVEDRVASSSIPSSSEVLCENSAVVKGKFPSVDTSEPYANPYPVDVTNTVVNTSSDVSTEADDSEDTEELPPATPDTSGSDEFTIKEDEVKATAEIDTWEPEQDHLVADGNTDQRPSAVVPPSPPTPDEDTSANDTAAAVDSCASSPSDEDASVKVTTAADDFTDYAKPTYKRAGMMSPMESMGPSIMFNRLLGDKDTTLPVPVPPFRQELSTMPAHWDQPEQVPAYQTRSHAS
jgi:hypothetical protein